MIQNKIHAVIILVCFSMVAISAAVKKKVTAADLSYHKESFEKIEFNKNGVATIVTKNGWVAINKKHEILYFPFLYDNGPDYEVEGFIRFVENGKMGFVNNRGEKIIKAQFDFVYPFEGGVAKYCMGCQTQQDGEHTVFKKGVGRWGEVNKKGKILN